MNLDHEKAINYLLYEKFRNAHDNISKSFNDWCKEKGLTKAELETSNERGKVCDCRNAHAEKRGDICENCNGVYL
jgi:hypothetical protein